jgi:hypothetical protein
LQILVVVAQLKAESGLSMSENTLSAIFSGRIGAVA